MTETEEIAKGSKAWSVLLIISSAAIGFLGIYTIAGVFGFSIG